MNLQKTSLSAFDSKRWIEEDRIITKAFGYCPQGIYPPPTEAEEKEFMEWLDEIFGG